MELIDVNPGNEVVDIYQHALQDQGHGRIAVVGSDGTTYDIAQQCGMLIALEKEVEKLQPLVYKLEEDNVTDSPHDLSLKLVTLQDSLHQLSDVRSINGFSAYENKIYGHAGLFCHTLSLSIQNYRKRTEQEYDLGEFEPLVELYRMIQESNVAEMEKEYMSPTGINLPFYFNPRLKPEDVKHAIHKHH